MLTGPDHQDPTAVLAAYWNESERRLYPTATTNPDAYQAAVKMVRAVADALAPVSGLDELAERWQQRSDILDEAARSAGAAAAHGLADETLGAGFALRRREILDERAARRRRQRIEAAREQGQDWAVIHEQGDLGSGLADPYQRMELHLRSGLAVVSMVEPDPSTMAPVYVVMVTAMGDGDGPTVEVDADLLAGLETADAETFEQNRAAARRRVEAAGG